MVRSPLLKVSLNILSLVNIGLLTYKDEKFGVTESFEDYLKNNYDNNMKNFLTDRKSLAERQRIQVLVAGRIIQPRLHCLKEVNPGEDSNLKVIHIALKRGPVQKFKLPFKGLAKEISEMDVEFSFLRTSAQIGKKG